MGAAESRAPRESGSGEAAGAVCRARDSDSNYRNTNPPIHFDLSIICTVMA